MISSCIQNLSPAFWWYDPKGMKAMNRIKSVALVLGISLLAAVAINLVLLHFLGQTSAFRAAHSLVGIILLMGFFYTLRPVLLSRIKLTLLFAMSLLPCYLGTVWPDLDIRLFGIRAHRNPIFHSGVAFFVGLMVFRRVRFIPAATVISAFGVGIAAHLIWDVFDHADVRWIPGGTLDRIWLISNAMLCLGLARQAMGSRMESV